MRNLLLAAAFAAALGQAESATAQIYPSRPITMVVPFPAGGPADAMARILAERMRASLGQGVVIENTPGAGGTIGVGRSRDGGRSSRRPASRLNEFTQGAKLSFRS
jgi:tripartite-type tricarboxylate transporter receptor subunit TctC